MKFWECWRMATVAVFTWMGVGVGSRKISMIVRSESQKITHWQALPPTEKETMPSNPWQPSPWPPNSAGAWQVSQLCAGAAMKKPLVQTSLLQKKPTQLVQAKGKKRKKYKQRGFSGFTGFLRDHKEVEPGVWIRTQDCCLFLWGSHLCFSEIPLYPLSFRASSDMTIWALTLQHFTILAPKGPVPVILGLNSKLP